MKIDKQNGNVKYNDSEHVYWDDHGKYISVTTLIHKYTQEFNSDFWSVYKALEILLSKEEFKLEKSSLLKTKRINIQYFKDTYNLSDLEINKAQQKILDEWAEKNRTSCERGTAIHLELEKKYTSNKYCDLKKYGIGGKFEVNTNENLEKHNRDLLEIDKGVFPEYLIYRISEDKKFKLAGQIDLLIKDGNDIYIFDYKSNESLDEKSYYDPSIRKNQMMKYPLNNLMDCNKMHYSMQLSTYAWMLQQINPEFNIKKLMLIHYDHKGGVSEHTLDYMKEEVLRMCKDYKKQILLEENKNKRKRIEF